MSKIGRMPIAIDGVKVELKGQEVHCTASKSSCVYLLPEELSSEVSEDNKELFVRAAKDTKDTNRLWGLHRALLSNKIHGISKGFEKLLEINGLGYKAKLSGNNIEFSLGFSHKINFELPEGVSLETDRSGQKLTFKSQDKELLGHVCSMVRALKPPEPYKGTGIKYATEVINRKVGKAKS